MYNLFIAVLVISLLGTPQRLLAGCMGDDIVCERYSWGATLSIPAIFFLGLLGIYISVAVLCYVLFQKRGTHTKNGKK